MSVEHLAKTTWNTVFNEQIVKPIYIYIFEQGKNWPQKPTINNYINKDNELEYIYLRHIATLSTPVDIRNHVYYLKSKFW